VKAFRRARICGSGTQAHGNNRFRTLGRAALDRVETHPKPIIAALRGWAIGGGFALAMACDVRIASTTAKFRTGDAYLGVIPSWGMSLTRLVHYIGRNRALDMLILGEDLSPQKAVELGLVTRVVADQDFDAEVARVAERVAGSAAYFRAIRKRCARSTGIRRASAGAGDQMGRAERRLAGFPEARQLQGTPYAAFQRRLNPMILHTAHRTEPRVRAPASTSIAYFTRARSRCSAPPRT
jgi:enoyl-CoA hydratase/carnithine racemase